MSNQISITQAAAAGVERVRMERWSNQLDHLKIDVIDGKPGPWTHLFAPFNMECNKRDPVDVLFVHMDYEAQEYVPYTGPLPDSDEYKSAQAEYSGVLSDT